MAQLTIHGKEVTSIFQLLGEDENDISYSIGWTLAHSPAFLKTFLENVTGQQYNLTEVLIRLQAYQKGKGFTDFEIEIPGELYLIIEAKKGWTFPSLDQLTKYVHREDFRRSRGQKFLIVLNDCSPAYNSACFTHWQVEGQDVKVYSYRQLFDYLHQSHPEGSNAEKRLLVELRTYLKQLITMQDKTSNMVWVVSLGEGHHSFSTLSFREMVEKKNFYCHPIGGAYRKEPPNYIGFRFDGKLQAIHHVSDYEVFTNACQIDAEFKDEELSERYYLYRLGPSVPIEKIPKGPKIVMANRVECMLDTLLTSSSISEALEITNQRLQEQ